MLMMTSQGSADYSHVTSINSNHYPVRVHDSVNSMRYCQYRAVGELLLDRLLD